MKFLIFTLTLFIILGCTPQTERSKSVVVIDAGHGGHDTGAVSKGKREKDLVLKVVKKLYRALKKEGYSVYTTRNRDNFLKLSQRTKMADRKKAQVFISIHANAISQKSRFEKVEGIETYYLQKTRDARSQRIAKRENASVLKGTSSELTKNIIIDSVLSGPKVLESHKLAIDVQKNMVKNLKKEYKGVKDGGAKPGPFYILVGASRPSILVEMGYMTNSKERKRLYEDDYQDAIVDGIVNGVNDYLDNRKSELGF